MAEDDARNERNNDLPSRTSILVAAARAFASREPDESVRNPDWLADRLIGPSELALISEHPLSRGLQQDYSEASQNPAIVLFASEQLVRTRFIDEALERAVRRGVTQIVILGAGFDSRAYRFQELLKHCNVFEVDAAPTQGYKRRRVAAALLEVPPNLVYCEVDFAKDDVIDVLRAAGFREDEKTFYILEGVSMYVPEEGVRKTLRMVAMHSAPGSSLVLDYANSLGIEMIRANPQGPIGMAAAWGEPWIFGVPGTNGGDFFRELGFDPGVPVATSNPEIIKRYATRQDGTLYAAHIFKKMLAEAQTRPPREPSAFTDARKTIAAAGGVYWFAELTVPDNHH